MPLNCPDLDTICKVYYFIFYYYVILDGSLDLAVEEISQLSGVAKGSSTCHRWLEIARARLMVQQSLNILSDHISLSEATVRKNSKLAFL